MLGHRRILRRYAYFAFAPIAVAVTGGLLVTAACGGDPNELLADPDVDPASGVPSDGDIGSITLHRLNSAEYDNTVRDLLGDTSHPSRAFPAEYGANGFTNNADELSISPILFEQYELAADKLATVAVGNKAIMICGAEVGAEKCAKSILAKFLRNAWRRPPTQDEISTLASLVDVALSAGDDFQQGMQLALKAALLSPHFLFRVEIDPDPASTTPHRVTDHELASRLSYLLWSSMPDDVLLELADAGKLHTDYDRQIERMLADAKSTALLDNFAAEWLNGALDDAKPSAEQFPAFDEGLRQAMAGETRAFVQSFLFGDASMLDMLDANFTFVNSRLADFYGLSPVSGDAFTRVSLDTSSHRGGLLKQASLLTMTSIATRTSPVRRGEWVLANLLCSPPPPPPPDVPALPPTITTGTMRQRMEEHRKNPACASCHTLMDPIGLGLEHYDGIGRYREMDQGQAIDASGSIGKGTYQDADGLAKVLKEDPRLVSCMTQKVFAYALGRSPQPLDKERLTGLAASFSGSGHRMKALLSAVTHNGAFLLRRGGN